ncbi:teichoic acid transport system ATP-binding protein [Vibrio diazotrophicus]|uniref:Teichoic acid transport system ATP-binding protein n=1 Tax=Vibrio diazotrophicus TaxID=685 RepID=A0A329DZ46_VIBDI|nr:ABC transporter ATP-binding protein [Vibrio diazotrophicus]RAS55679.1 teichoic acid transport system ATP-binding protein [Vibrio diazotrophicus]
MSSDVIIKAQDLSKCYLVYDNPKHRLTGPIINRIRKVIGMEPKSFYREHWVLKSLNFSINKGDSVGIVGKNGAGKSTLLQMLTGTLTPTTGNINLQGRVAALLELGAGFNPDFTGHENVYMNASILGLSQEEIDEKYDEIIDFADIGEFIHQPVKTYSSGMYVRLAFAIAANIKPDILIIDEALAVGDIRFQLKCLKHMNQLKKNGVTILFVSHSPEQVKRFCNKAIWIDQGSIKEYGSASHVCDQYNDYMNQIESDETVEHEYRRESGSPARIKSTKLDSDFIKTGDSLSLTIEYEVLDDKVDGLLVGAALYTNDRKYIFGINTDLDSIEINNTKGIHKIDYKIPNVCLLPGSFSFDVGIMGEKSLIGFDYISDAEKFTIFNDYVAEGLINLEHEWSQQL